jgi:uncharacterized membrane protein YsdA (DUF1294 family)
MPYVVFSVVAVLPLAILFALLNIRLDWPEYLIWLVAVNIITFCVYGLDKVLSKVRWLRAPNVTLHGLALAGGFLGGWAGRSVFHHKTNTDKYPEYPMILAASTLVHVAIMWYVFVRPG